MNLVRFLSQNHPQQVKRRGALDEVDDRRTPSDLFDGLNARHRFTIDVAASSENAKLPRWFDRSLDALKQPWKGERVWCNPPYSNLSAWVDKAWQEMKFGGCEAIVMLLPANRTDQDWWHTHVEPYRERWHYEGLSFSIEFLRGRIPFERSRPYKGGNRPPFGCVLLVWGRR